MNIITNLKVVKVQDWRIGGPRCYQVWEGWGVQDAETGRLLSFNGRTPALYGRKHIAKEVADGAPASAVPRRRTTCAATRYGMALTLNPKSSTRTAAMTTNIDAEWATKKARWMVEREIHLISTSAAPSAEPCLAMVEAYAVVCLLTEQQQNQYIDQATAAERQRRRQLTASRVTRLLEEIRDDDQTRAISR